MPYTSSYTKTYTIVWLSQDDMTTGKAPEFALLSDRSNKLGNTIAGYLLWFDLDIFHSKEYWDKVQAIFTILEDWEEAKIKVNMSSAVRTIMNKLASQKTFGKISIQLLNTSWSDWKRYPGTIVYNDKTKIDTKFLDKDDKSIWEFKNPMNWLIQKIYSTTEEFQKNWYKAKQFDVILANKIREIIESSPKHELDEEDTPF